MAGTETDIDKECNLNVNQNEVRLFFANVLNCGSNLHQ